MKYFLSLAVLASAVVANAQFVNGDFSSGNFTGWTIANTVNGTSSIQSVDVIDIDLGGPLTANNAGHFAVGNVVTPNQPSQGITITQMLNLTAGIQYTFDFDALAVNTSTVGNSDGGQFRLIVNGTAIASFLTASIAGLASENGHLTGVFTPTVSGNHSVGASITRNFLVPGGATPTLTQYVDNFTMSPAVPEPASMAILGAGALALLRRRRK